MNDPEGTKRSPEQRRAAAPVSARPLGRVEPGPLAFPRQLVAIEIDGRSAHGVARFEADRWRQNDLVLAEWTVLRFTWSLLVDDPEEVIRLIRVALAGSV